MRRRFPMFMFGMRCVRCNHEIIAPHKSELLDDEVIRHLWHCPCCKAMFESIPRFPANAKLVKEVMMSVEVFPPRNEMRDSLALDTGDARIFINPAHPTSAVGRK